MEKGTGTLRWDFIHSVQLFPLKINSGQSKASESCDIKIQLQKFEGFKISHRNENVAHRQNRDLELYMADHYILLKVVKVSASSIKRYL